MSILVQPYRPETGQLFAECYRCIRMRGEGGMGQVWEVVDERTGFTRALKVLTATSPTARERFEREHRTLRGLRHPNLVRAFDGGNEPVPYFTMDLLRGVTWLEAFAGLAVTDPERGVRVLSTFLQALRVMGYLHGQGILHRDFKPDNALVLRGKLLKVIDLGLQRQKGRAFGELSQTGIVVGTAWYMAPESLLDEKHDARSELYSLGVALYELLTGEVPFPADTMAELVRQAPIEARPVEDVNPAIDRRLAGVCNRLIRKDADLRFQSVAQVWDKLVELGLAAERRKTKRYVAGPGEPTRALVGRGPEVAALARTIAETKDAATLSAVLVRGPLHIGKSRLITELREQAAAAGFDVHATACLGQRFSPFGDVGGLGESLEETARRAGLSVERVWPRSGRLQEGDWPAAFQAMQSMLAELGAKRPQLIVFDDWHRVEPRAAELVMELAAALKPAEHGVMLAFVYRPEEMANNDLAYRALLRVEERTRPVVLEPGPFTTAEVAEVVAQRSGVERPPAAVVEWLAQATGGVAGFLDEALETLEKRSDLKALVAGEKKPTEVEALPFFRSLVATVHRQFSRADDEERWLIELLVHTPMTVDQGMLERASGFDRERFRGALWRLMRTSLVERDEDGQLKFRYEQARGIFFERTDGAFRAARRWGETLETVLGEGREDVLPALAQQACEGVDHEGMLAHMPRAAAWLYREGRIEEALELAVRFRTALEDELSEHPRAPLERTRTEVALGDLLEALGRHRESYEHYQAAGGLARDGKVEETEPVLAVEVLAGLAQALRRRGELGEALRFAEEAAARAKPLGSKLLLARTHTILGNVLCSRGDWEGAIREAKRARRWARMAGDRAAEARALRQIGEGLFAGGRLDAAFEALTLARGQADLAGDERVRGQVLNMIGVLHWQRGELERALAVLGEAVTSHERSGNRFALGAALKVASLAHAELGNWQALEETAERARPLFEETHDPINRVTVELIVVDSLLRQGKVGEARAQFERAAALGAGLEEAAVSVSLLCTRAEVEEAEGKCSEARASAEKALEAAEKIGYLDAEATALRLIERCGGEKREKLELVLERARGQGQPRVVQLVAHHLAMRAEAAGKTESAQKRFEEAWEAARERARRLGRFEQAFLHAHEVEALRRDFERCRRRWVSDSGLFDPALVGRGAELERVQKELEQARKDQKLTVVLVRGALGTGKTRFLQELKELARHEGFEPHLTSCYGHDYRPYGDLVGLGESLYDGIERVGRRGLAKALEPLASVTQLADLLGIDTPRYRQEEADPSTQRLRVLASLRDLFATLHETKDQALLFDDWHRAEPRAVELVETLVSEVFTSRGAVLIFGLRAEEPSNERASRVLSKLLEWVTPLVIDLGPLDEQAIAKCVLSMTDLRAVSGDLVTWLERETKGIARFAVEGIRALHGRGDLRPVAEGKLAVEELKPLPLCGGLEHDVRETWRGLETNPRLLLELMAATHAVVTAVYLEDAAELGEEPFEAGLARVLRTGLVVEDKGSYRFYHPQVRDALLRLFTVRDAVHASWLRVLEKRFAPGREALLPYLAEHASAAGDVERTGRYLRQAADWLAQMHQLEPALATYQSYRQWLEGPGASTAEVVAEWVRARLASGEILELLGRYKESYEEYRLAVEKAKAAAEPERISVRMMIEGLLGLAAMERKRGEFTEAEAHAREALAAAQGCDAKPLVSASLAEIGLVFRQRGDWVSGHEFATQALEVARIAEDKRAEVRALWDVGVALFRRGLGEPALESLTSAYSKAKHLRHDRAIAQILNALGVLHQANGDLDEARAAHQNAIRYREKVGDVIGLAYAHEKVGIIAVETGDWRAATEMLERARALYARAAHGYHVGSADLWLAQCDRQRGRFKEARARLDGMLEKQTESGLYPDMLYLRAEVALAMEATADAVRYGRQAVAEARKRGSERALAVSFAVLAAAGEDVVAELETALLGARQRKDDEVIFRVAHRLGVSACERGDLDRGHALLSEASRAVDGEAARLAPYQRVLLQSPEVKLLKQDETRWLSER